MSESPESVVSGPFAGALLLHCGPEGADDPAHFLGLSQQRDKLRLRQKVHLGGDVQLGSQFGAGAFRRRKPVMELGWRLPFKPLGDI